MSDERILWAARARLSGEAQEDEELADEAIARKRKDDAFDAGFAEYEAAARGRIEDE